MLKALIFDLDGVITETAQMHYQAWAKTVKKLGIQFTAAENVQLKGLSRLDTLRAILQMHGKTQLLSKQELVRLAEEKNQLYKQLLEKGLTKANILPGIETLLQQAKSQGYKLAIASSSYNAPLILEKLHLNTYFDFVVSPGSVARGKPAPDLFLAACYGLNVKASEALGFEDALPGVAGLKAAGIKTVAITHGDNGDWSSADFIVQSTRELKLSKIVSMLFEQNNHD